MALARIHKHVSKIGCPAWDGGPRLHLPPNQTRSANTEDAPKDDIDKCELLRHPRGDLNIILTPSSFLAPAAPERFVDWANDSASRDGVLMTSIADRPDVFILHGLSDDSLSSQAPKQSPDITYATVSTVAKPLESRPSIPRDPANRSTTKKDTDYVFYYQRVVSKGLIPSGVSARIDGIGGAEDVIVLHSKIFRPVG